MKTSLSLEFFIFCDMTILSKQLLIFIEMKNDIEDVNDLKGTEVNLLLKGTFQ